MDFSQIKNHLISHREHAQHQIDYIKAHRHMKEDELHTYIYDYVPVSYTHLIEDIADKTNLYMTFHSTPNRNLKGLKAEKERYRLAPFAYSGFGATIQMCIRDSNYSRTFFRYYRIDLV